MIDAAREQRRLNRLSVRSKRLATTTPTTASGFQPLMKSFLPPRLSRSRDLTSPRGCLLPHRGPSLTELKSFCQPFSKTIASNDLDSPRV